MSTKYFYKATPTQQVTALILLCFCLIQYAHITSAQSPNDNAAGSRPNVIYILADDLGIGDIEPFGQQHIKTPNLNRMMREGMVLTQHYAGNTVCAPSRASLMTGLHSGHTQIRGNFELGGFTDEEEFGQMPLNPGTDTVATMLQDAGYRTGMIGKWGLGGPGSYGTPNKHGFDYFLGYLDQKQAHNHYPTHLWENEERYPLENTFLHPHQSLPDSADPYDETSYTPYKRKDYAQTRLTGAALKFIETTSEQPFFLYLAYATPHAALQVAEKELAPYSAFNETPYTAKRNYLPHPKPRAARAAMISNIDSSVGKIMERFEELQIDDNTLIIFSSDNGPTPEGGGDMEFFDSNSYYRGYKRDLYEGGIRMPTLARWPSRIQSGSRSDHVSAFWDLMPTLAELAGTEPPKTDGLSFLPTLMQKEGQEQHQSLYWEFHNTRGGHVQAVRFLDDFSKSWKAVRLYSQSSDTEPAIELYDLDNDPGESIDLAAKSTTLVERAREIMNSSRSRSFIETWNFD
tara:strand:+ start:184 stop:1731 length:1548 start_codon:yes stop_codon:yes gene_type:complete